MNKINPIKNTKEIFLPSELNDDIFKELLPNFLDEVQADFKLLQEASLNREFKKIRLISHKIKGISTCYGTQFITKYAHEINLNSEDYSKVIKNLNQLKIEIKEMVKHAKSKFGI